MVVFSCVDSLRTALLTQQEVGGGGGNGGSGIKKGRSPFVSRFLNPATDTTKYMKVCALVCVVLLVWCKTFH